MRSIILFVISTFFFQFAFSQMEGKITYNEKIKFTIDFEGIDESMKDMFPESQTFTKELIFTSKESIYKTSENGSPDDLEMESDDGSIKIKMVSDDTEDILYKNIKDKKIVHQKGFMGKSFVVSEDLNKNKWKLTNEKIKYLDYECQKAVIEDEDKFVVAWFTSQLPVQIGPASYHGLPGAILMLNINDGESEIMATSVDLTKLDDKAIFIPSKGKKVSPEEFEKIKIEKEKEMKEMSGGRSVRIRH